MAAVGVARGTFYLYFPSKRALAFTLLKELQSVLLTRAPRLQSSDDPFDSIHVFNRYYVEVYRRNAGLYRCINQLNDEMREFREFVQQVDYSWALRLARRYDRWTGSAGTEDDAKLLVIYAMESMVADLMREIYVDANPRLAEIVQTDDVLAEYLSLLWYRALYGANPPAAKLKHTTAFAALRLARR